MNNFERLKRDIQKMTIDQFSEFLMLCGKRGEDWYTGVVCRNCQAKHNGCPTGGNSCIYPDDYKADVKLWLELEVADDVHKKSDAAD